MKQFHKGVWYDAVELAESVGRKMESTPCPRCHAPRVRAEAKLGDTRNTYRRICRACGFKEEFVHYVNQ